jgi:hypothetical protein
MAASWARFGKFALCAAAFALSGCAASVDVAGLSVHASEAQIAREAAAREAHAQRWSEFDLNRDGGLNRSEWRAYWWAYELIWDADGSGDFDLSEWVHRECGVFRDLPLYPPCSSAAHREFISVTGNRYGRLTERVHRRSSDRFFSANDKDADGVITQEEMLRP